MSAAGYDGHSNTWHCNRCLAIQDKLVAAGRLEAVDPSFSQNNWETTLASKHGWCQRCGGTPFDGSFTTHVVRDRDGKLHRFGVERFYGKLIELLARKLFSAAGGSVCSKHSCECGGRISVEHGGRMAAEHTTAAAFRLCEFAD